MPHKETLSKITVSEFVDHCTVNLTAIGLNAIHGNFFEGLAF